MKMEKEKLQKEYSAPEMTVIELKLESQLLAGSNPTNALTPEFEQEDW